MSQETINNLHEIYRNKCILMGQSAAPDPGKELFITCENVLISVFSSIIL